MIRSLPLNYKGEGGSSAGVSVAETRATFKNIPAMVDAFKNLATHLAATQQIIKDFNPNTFDERINYTPNIPEVIGDTPEGHEYRRA